MILNFEKIDDDSRLWIYQSNRTLSNHEKILISEKIEDFLKSWTSHGNDLFCSFKIKYDLFIFIVLDEQQSAATGCSIDKLTAFIRSIENDLSISLLDRLYISYRQNEVISVEKLNDFKDKILKEKITNNTIVFNNLITHKKDLLENWEVPVSKSWHLKLLT
tara:strand:+ start:18 stop:503 length:486 start_codon:yes stop_codon:yes gene_type:complete